jgi:hypothetical protein
MIKGAFETHKIDKYFKDIFACTMDEDSDGYINFPKETVGHTIKTQKIFMISKGVLPSFNSNPNDVNKLITSYRSTF